MWIHKICAHEFADETIISHFDKKSEKDNNINLGHARYIGEGG